MITDRQQQLLQFVIESYISSAEPIGSKFVVDEGNFEVSGATIRNELRELEAHGYLTHPHTSAGRIPTEQGYQYYVQALLPKDPLSPAEQEGLQEVLSFSTQKEEELKRFAKETAVIVDAAVVVCFDQYRVYYTGMSALFSQPEFQDYAETIRMSELFDHIEDRIGSLLDLMDGEDTHIFVGAEHPLGSATSIIARRLGTDGVILYLAPLRMKYSTGHACLQLLASL